MKGWVITKAGRFLSVIPPDLNLRSMEECILKTQYGLMYGQLERIVDLSREAQCEVIRRATLQDRGRAAELNLKDRMAESKCEMFIQELKLEMEVFKVFYNFDGTMLIVFFTSDGRVDFRELVKRLSKELSVKVYMQQINEREKVAILGAIGVCGRQTCCRTWLKDPAYVDVRSAKIQQVALNPAISSGICGKLKCCLNYEEHLYEELNSGLPRVGVSVTVPDGRLGKVIDKNVLSTKVKVQFGNSTVEEFYAAELKYVDHSI